MSRTTILNLLLIAVIICTIATVATTDHILTAAISGAMAGYCIGLRTKEDA